MDERDRGTSTWQVMEGRDRYQIEIFAGGTVALHDNATGKVLDSFDGKYAYLDASAAKACLDEQVSDEHLWAWIGEGETE